VAQVRLVRLNLCRNGGGSSRRSIDNQSRFAQEDLQGVRCAGRARVAMPIPITARTEKGRRDLADSFNRASPEKPFDANDIFKLLATNRAGEPFDLKPRLETFNY
jgi:hypothetical protein